jgi:hypothetical protein
MNSSMVMATKVEPRICTTAAWLRPSKPRMTSTTRMVSGTLATEVIRWCQKCLVPDFAEPRWRTRASGVRMLGGE